MTKEELIHRINDLEWYDFEVKEAKSELPKSIWETVSAFANTSGGWIVLGIRQVSRDFIISGVDNIEKLEQDFLGTIRSQKFNAPIDAQISKFDIDGKKVLAFHVASSPQKPIYFNNPQNTFIRFGSGDQRATNAEITAMFRNQAFGVKSEQTIPGTGVEMLNMDSLHGYRNYMKIWGDRPELTVNDDEDFCKKLGICDQNGLLNYGGLIMFGKYEFLREYVPTFWMDLVEIPGNSVAEAKVRYTYRIPEQDNLWEYYLVLIKRLRLLVDTPFKMNREGFNIEDQSQFKILREALVNMLVHADHFSTIHSCIHVYVNRVEFFNAGAFPIPIEQIGEKLYSNPRNPIIAKLFRLVHLSETVGYGMDLMREWKPITGFAMSVTSDITSTTVTFYLQAHNVNDNVNDNVNNILNFCIIPKSRREIFSHIGLAYHTDAYQKHIEPLVSAGLIELTVPEKPKSRNQKFITTEKGKRILSDKSVPK